jgi:hypothetical protein
LYSIFNTINDLPNKITKDMITDDIYYNNYITQLNYILTKIEPLLNRLKMFEPDSDNSRNIENDSVQLRFYLGDITGYNEDNPIEE